MTDRRSLLARFLAVEAAGGIVLLVATAAALGWANSPWSAAYEDLWRGSRHWVNDGLMAVFFFVAGLEIRREMVDGELADRRAAALPVAAAIGGMVVPALVFLSLNAGGAGGRGWGIPMATDIAFAVGVLALLGRRVPAAVRTTLLALAIVDDIGAIIVIAVVYAGSVSFVWLVAAVAGLGVVALRRRLPSSSSSVFALAAVAVWFATLQSGVHPTIAGVALALVAPAPLAARLEAALHPWASFVIVPVFALANAGIAVSSDLLADAVGSPVAVGVAAGLVVGKLAGISAGAGVAVALGWAVLPGGVCWRHIVGIAGLAGIGFTVSLFVTGLAFAEPALRHEATVGVLAASIVSAALGSAVLLRSPAAEPDTDVS